jgi:hypothetical protein
MYFSWLILSGDMQPARFTCEPRCLHRQLLFRNKKQSKYAGAGAGSKKLAKIWSPRDCLDASSGIIFRVMASASLGKFPSESWRRF